MKLVLLFVTLLLCISAIAKNTEDFEYYSAYSDYKVPSINAGMFVPAVGRKITSPTEFKAARIKAIKKWSDKAYYGVSGTEVIKLKVNSFIDKLIENGGGGKNYDLRILFEPIGKTIEVVLTSPISIIKNESYRTKKNLSKKEIMFLLAENVSDEYTHLSQLAIAGGFGVAKMGRIEGSKNKYQLQYVMGGGSYSKLVPLDVEPKGVAYLNTKFNLIHFSEKLKNWYTDKILFYNGKAIVFFGKGYRDLRLDSKISTSNEELYLLSYGSEYTPRGRTICILKKKGNKFIELRSRLVVNVARHYSDPDWNGWD
jgi:hypothetical protein